MQQSISHQARGLFCRLSRTDTRPRLRTLGDNVNLSDDRSDRGQTEAGIRAFLIADVRGYTRFTQEQGDEAAAKLAAKFALIAREGIEAKDGTVVELRGDEVLAVFASSRQAIRAAVALQAAFAVETTADPSLPLGVGIGLDAGEAVSVEGGYRGGPLNLAARLCGQARQGEILASRETVHMARRVSGIRYEDRGSVHLKGIDEPVPMVRVVSEEADPAAFFATRRPPRRSPPGRWAPARALTVGVAVVLLLAAGVWLLVDRGDGSAAFPTGPNTVAVIDAASGEVVDGIALGGGALPGALAAGLGSVWVANGSGTIAQIDPDTHSVTRTFSTPQGSFPSGVAAGEGSVWIATGLVDSVGVFDPAVGGRVLSVRVPNATDVAVGFGWVWATDSAAGFLYRIDPDSFQSTSFPLDEQVRDQEPTGVAVGEEGVWIANTLAHTVTRVDPQTGQVLIGSIAVDPCAPEQVAAGAGYVWMTCRQQNLVVKIDPTTNTLVETIEVAAGPSDIVATERAVWITSGAAGAVQQIDPGSDRVVKTIHIEGHPRGVIVMAGRVWVSVSGAE